MSKIHVRLPMDLYNELFIRSVQLGKTMSSIVIDTLMDRLFPFPLPRAANDNRRSRRYE